MRRVIIAAALVWAVIIAGALAFYFAPWSKPKGGSKPAQQTSAPTGEKRFAWLSQALDACEGEAARYPQSLYFMVVPLSAVPGGADIRAQALETIGPATLLESKVALDALESGALRISREQFILHVLDQSTNAVHRFNSVTGVSTLSERNNNLKGPFKIRLQTNPADSAEWSSVTAEGVATCHWVFAILPR
jgi:hypothetical protein